MQRTSSDPTPWDVDLPVPELDPHALRLDQLPEGWLIEEGARILEDAEEGRPHVF